MLTYPMEERGSLPLYEYLCRRIRADILSGALPAGTRLPSKRALAEHLRVSVVTVESAYSQLEAEGYLQARPKRGFFVSAVERAPPPAVRSVLMPETPAVSWRLDLGRNQVDTARFPVSTWARLTRQVLSEAPEALLSPVPHQGLAALRQAIASGAGTDVIEASARQAGMVSLFEHGCRAVEQGLTTIEELLRVLGMPNGG